MGERVVELLMQQGLYASHDKPVAAGHESEDNPADPYIALGLAERTRDGRKDEIRRPPGSERCLARGEPKGGNKIFERCAYGTLEPAADQLNGIHGIGRGVRLGVPGLCSVEKQRVADDAREIVASRIDEFLSGSLDVMRDGFDREPCLARSILAEQGLRQFRSTLAVIRYEAAPGVLPPVRWVR
jgi:hypothetical protein